jgi:hypothetical protein
MAKINAKTTGGGGIETVGDASGVLELQSDGTTRQYIDASGNVGIGTSSPTAKLQANITSAGSNTIPLVVSNTSATTSTECSIGFSPFSDTSIITGSIGLLNQGSGAYSLKFSNWNGSANVERMRIDTSGNVLVGTTTSGLTGSGFSVTTYASGRYIDIGHTTGDTGGDGYARFIRAGTVVGQITSNGTTQVSYATSSDYRLKENIAPMTGALDTVAKLKPVTYNWKIDGSDGQGFIAHELAEVVPDCVTGEKDAVDAEGNPVYQGIDTSFLVATLTAAIQEQQAIITDLKARIEVLENSNGID